MCKRGFRVQGTHDGLSALATAAEFQPDIVFLDIGLPDSSGHDVARALRDLPQYSTTKLVALTGGGSLEDCKAALAAGVDSHRIKPVDVKDILSRIETLHPAR